jgi:GMP synthase-like glutamine amidotransferase
MKILLLQHVEHEHPGYISQYASDKGITVDIIELWKPYTIPDYKTYDALIIMGGPMGVYENFLSKHDEIEVIKNAIGQLPIIGFCLGSQLIAHALGARVYQNIQNDKAIKEVGYFPIKLTKYGQNSQILKGFSPQIKALQWHGDIFEMPEGAKLLCSSDLVKNQAFSYQNCYGFLFHFEFTPDMIAKQIEIDRTWIHQDNELDEAALITLAAKYAETMKRQCYQLLDNFLHA